MDRFLDTLNLSELNHDESPNRQITKTDIKSVIKNLPATTDHPGPDAFADELYLTFEELIPISFKLFKII